MSEKERDKKADTPYYHVVFTVPHEINTLFLSNPKQLYNLLFSAAWKTIEVFAKDSKFLGAQTATVAVLHTWGQNISLHPHLHCLVPGGGITKQGKWRNMKKSQGKFLFPVKAMSKVYKAKFLSGVSNLAKEKEINLVGCPFSNYSFGYRPKRNTSQAVHTSLNLINSGYQHIVEIDLKGFFDEVDHCLLLNLLYQKVKCPVTLQLIRRWLRAPIWINGQLVKRRKGVSQGSPISPLLSNIMLHELDTEMENRSLRFVRYADDFSIYCKTKQEARKVGNEIYVFLRDKLKLPINKEKSGIRRPVNFTILGYGFLPTYRKGEQGTYQLVVDKERWKFFKAKLKEITRKTNPMSFEERVQKLKQYQRGWIDSFRLANSKGKFLELDGWLRNRLRYCIWHHWKKRDRKRKNLIKLGVPPSDASRWSNSRLGGWAT